MSIMSVVWPFSILSQLLSYKSLVNHGEANLLSKGKEGTNSRNASAKIIICVLSVLCIRR